MAIWSKNHKSEKQKSEYEERTKRAERDRAEVLSLLLQFRANDWEATTYQLDFQQPNGVRHGHIVPDASTEGVLYWELKMPGSHPCVVSSLGELRQKAKLLI